MRDSSAFTDGYPSPTSLNGNSLLTIQPLSVLMALVLPTVLWPTVCIFASKNARKSEFMDESFIICWGGGGGGGGEGDRVHFHLSY